MRKSAIFLLVLAFAAQASAIRTGISVTDEPLQGELAAEVVELKKELDELRAELKDIKKFGMGYGNAAPPPADGPQPYNDTITYLINQMHMDMPRSYQDIIPVPSPGQPGGTNYWTTSMYLKKGAVMPRSSTDLTEVPVPLDNIIAVQERSLTRYGLNLYDGAVWQIALTIAGRKDLADMYQNNILYTSQTGSNLKTMPVSGVADIRADKEQYAYGKNKIKGKDLDKVKLPGNASNIPQAGAESGEDNSGFSSMEPVWELPGGLFMRIITPTYQMLDPLTGNFANSWKFPYNYDTTTKWNTVGIEHVNDWKPIMGENAWAAFTGPLQTMFIENCTDFYNVTHDPTDMPDGMCLRKFSTFEDTPAPIQLGLSLLPALKELQSPLGSMYHCPKGSALFPNDTSQCDGKLCGEETNISNENNVSAFAAFRMIWQILFNRTDSSVSDETLVKAKTDFTNLVQGLEDFFQNYLVWESKKTNLPSTGKPLKAVSQGGHVLFDASGQDGYFPAPVEVTSGYAADCTTWGLGVLGLEYVEDKFGYPEGTAYELWQTTKYLTGYFENSTGELGGIGYTNVGCSNKTNGEFFEDCEHQYWSAEWTFGAINMCERIAHDYEKKGCGDCGTWAADMRKDVESMRKIMRQPMTRAADLSWIGGGLMQEDGSYLYANRRFFIPWGWYANPIGALCSTGWAVLDNFKFNPFILGGGFESAIPDPSSDQLRAHAEHHKKLFGEEPGFRY